MRRGLSLDKVAGQSAAKMIVAWLLAGFVLREEGG